MPTKSILPNGIASLTQYSCMTFLHEFGFATGGEDQRIGQVHAKAYGVISRVARVFLANPMLFEPLFGASHRMTDIQWWVSRIVGVVWIGFGKTAEREHFGSEFDDVDRVDGWFADRCCHECSPRVSVTMAKESTGLSRRFSSPHYVRGRRNTGRHI